MPLDTSVKINACLARIAELRERARADADPALRAKLHDLELQWLGIVESYKVVEQSNRFLKGMRDRQSAREKKSEQTGDLIRANGKHIEAFPSGSGGSLASQLEVLVRAAVEHADGKARAAFYLADATGRELRHIVGMPQAYARHVNGFVISTQSLACGLAAATRRSVITPDVSTEPRWKQWLWLAEQFDYRACWSFPVATSSGKLLGSFAMYYKEPREATPRDVDLASVLARTAAAIISPH